MRAKIKLEAVAPDVTIQHPPRAMRGARSCDRFWQVRGPALRLCVVGYAGKFRVAETVPAVNRFGITYGVTEGALIAEFSELRAALDFAVEKVSA